MKKIAWLFILLSLILTMSWCKKTNVSQQLPTNETCKIAIQDYLNKIDLVWTWDKTIAKWSNIVVDYIWRLDDQNIFDTSIETIAKWCNNYYSWRDYKQWLAFQAWAWQMIPWFDNAIIWMKVWQTKTIKIPPEQAYWPRDENKLIKIPTSQVPNADQFKVGMKVQASNWQSFKVYAITKNEITMDANHELAGKTLIFDITIKEIK